MGRKPLPNEIKLLRGETRSERIAENVVEFPKAAEVPKPPSYFNRYSKQLWQEIAPILFAQRVLTIADLYALEHLCQLHGELVDMYRRKVEAPVSARNQIRAYFSEFGMTPASRAKVGAVGPKKEANGFKRNGKSQTD